MRRGIGKLLILLVLLTSSEGHALQTINFGDTLVLQGTLSNDLQNEGTLIAQNGVAQPVITGSLANNALTRISTYDGSGGFFEVFGLNVNGGIQNAGTIRLETGGTFGNSGAFNNLTVGLGTTLTNLPGGLIETTPHVGNGLSGNQINGDILNQGTLDHDAFTTLVFRNSAGDLVGADQVNAGIINLNTAGADFRDFNSFSNSGTIQGRSIVLYGLSNGIQPGDFSTITNSGLVDMTAGNLTTLNQDTFTNTPTGQITLTGGTGALAHFNSWVNQGGVTIGAGQAYGLNGGIFAGIAENQPGGVIGGAGSLNIVAGTTFTNNGTIAPGSSFGDLTVLGSVLQGTNGILDLEIGGTDPGVTHDRLVMDTGIMTLGGILRLSFMDGFAPTTGQEFDLIPGTVADAFDSVEILGLEPGFLYDLDTSSGLTLTALSDGVFVPEPSTALLLTSGLAALAIGRRRISPRGTL